MAGPARTPAPVCPTRQQLEELDALMQRMLALPVDEEEKPSPLPAEKPAGQRKEDSGPVLIEELLPAAADESPAAPQGVPSRAAPLPRVLAPAPALLRREEKTVPAPAISLRTADEPERLVPPELLAAPVAPWDEFPALAPEEPGGPLVALNRAFDAGTTLLGPVGGWLRSAGGRTWLGLLGLGLLLAALAWGLGDWLGWTW